MDQHSRGGEVAEMRAMRESMQAKLESLIGGRPPAWDVLCDRLFPVSDRTTVRKLGRTGAGGVFFASLALDLFDERSVGLLYEFGDGFTLHELPPQHLTEADLMRHSSVLVERDLLKGCLSGSLESAMQIIDAVSMDQSTLDVHVDEIGDRGEVAIQSRRSRLWLLRDGELVGVAVVSIATDALKSGQTCFVEIDIELTAGEFNEAARTQQLLRGLSRHCRQALQRVLWMRVGYTGAADVEVVLSARTDPGCLAAAFAVTLSTFMARDMGIRELEGLKFTVLAGISLPNGKDMLAFLLRRGWFRTLLSPRARALRSTG